MTTVNTVLGSVAADSLGVTYMHEHIFVVNPEMQYYWPGYQGWDEDRYVEKGRAALKKLHEEHGVDTVLDPTVAGLGRNIRAVAKALEGTGLNVVAATGWYLYSELPFTFYPKDFKQKIAELEMLFTRDFEEGLEGTPIKPGVIKCYTGQQGATPDIEASLRASARTHLKTGLSITTHTDYSNQGGLLQQAIFREEGVDMEAVVIGHCNQSDDIGYMEKLIEAGSLIGFDRCGLESPVAPQETQLDNLAELCQRGYSKRVVLSHDDMIFIDLMPPGTREKIMSHYPYGRIQAELLPGLRDRGVTEEQINDMLVEAPRAFFSRAGSQDRQSGPTPSLSANVEGCAERR
jgi:phosphotriesterase-related protein